MTNKQKVRSKEQKAERADNEQNVTSNNQKVMTKEQNVTSNEQKV